VRKVVDRARVEGVRSAVNVARERLDALAPLGYSSAGVVAEVAPGVDGTAPDDRVACGGGWASHAEFVSVPRNLVAKVPEHVDLAQATYATVGAIALHAVRQSEARLGERIGVIGLGLVGQLVARILVAAGCQPVGIDLDDSAVDLVAAGGRTDTAARRSRARGHPRRRDWRAWPGRSAALRSHVFRRPAAARGPACPRPRQAGGRRRLAGAGRSRPPVREGARASPLPLVRPRAVQPRLRGAGGATCRPATSAGPNSGICGPSSTSSPRAGSTLPSWRLTSSRSSGPRRRTRDAYGRGRPRSSLRDPDRVCGPERGRGPSVATDVPAAVIAATSRVACAESAAP
jgi:hypothetical protein